MNFHDPQPRPERPNQVVRHTLLASTSAFLAAPSLIATFMWITDSLPFYINTPAFSVIAAEAAILGAFSLALLNQARAGVDSLVNTRLSPYAAKAKDLGLRTKIGVAMSAAFAGLAGVSGDHELSDKIMRAQSGVVDAIHQVSPLVMSFAQAGCAGLACVFTAICATQLSEIPRSYTPK